MPLAFAEPALRSRRATAQADNPADPLTRYSTDARLYIARQARNTSR